MTGTPARLKFQTSFMSPCSSAQSMQKKLLKNPSRSPMPNLLRYFLSFFGSIPSRMKRFFRVTRQNRTNTRTDNAIGA